MESDSVKGSSIIQERPKMRFRKMFHMYLRFILARVSMGREGETGSNTVRAHNS
jgi:hypothetical protein